MRHSFVALALVLVVPCVAPLAAAQELSREDRELLDALLKDTLFDPPSDAERVVVRATLRNAWGGAEEVERDAWLLPATADQAAQVVFADGSRAPAPGEAAALPRVDLAAVTRERLRPRTEDDERDERFEAMARAAGRGAQTDPDLAIAAWLYRRGEEELAAGLLARARAQHATSDREAARSLIDALRVDLAWQLFAGMVHAYMVRADEEALAYGEELMARFPDQAPAQAGWVLAELRRRRDAGTFGEAPPSALPDEVAARPPAERVGWLIDALEEVDARQFSQPGGVDLSSDWRVAALIDLGEVAVPALIEAVEGDERLTRSVHFWRDFARSRTVLAVREAALVAVMSILRVQAFEPSSTGDNFTAADPERARATALRLREYWEANRGLSLEARMRRVLTDTSSSQAQLREAAQNLAELDGQRRIGTTVWATRTEPGTPGAPNPALALTDPTAAEAILSAMDRDLAAGDPRWRDDPRMASWDRRRTETHYIECLIALGDARILPQAQERARATDMPARRQWSLLCHALGDPAPLRAFWADFAAGTLTLPPLTNDPRRGNLHDEPGAVELRRCVETALRVDAPEADEALRAATRPGHPYREPLALLVLGGQGGGFDGERLFAHPFHLALLVDELERTEPTGTTFRLEGATLHTEYANGSSTGGLDRSAFGEAELLPRAAERRCDRAAERLSAVLLGVPRYHALLKDRDERLARLRETCAPLVRGARRATPLELEALGVRSSPWDTKFVPGLEPLDRPATPDDVAAGRAVFHLDGQGQLVDLKLPVTARLVLGDGRRVPVLVLQAEQLPSGERRYGVLAVDRVEAVGAERLEGLQALPDPAAQREAARRFVAAAAAGDVDAVRAMLGAEVLAEVEPHGGADAFVEQVRAALEQVPTEQLVEMIAPGFRAGDDGLWRLERLR